MTLPSHVTPPHQVRTVNWWSFEDRPPPLDTHIHLAEFIVEGRLIYLRPDVYKVMSHRNSADWRDWSWMRFAETANGKTWCNDTDIRISLWALDSEITPIISVYSYVRS